MTQARQVVSGVDVDDQGEVMSSGSSTHSASTSTKSDKKKLCPELEDLAILEEILDFCTFRSFMRNLYSKNTTIGMLTSENVLPLFPSADHFDASLG